MSSIGQLDIEPTRASDDMIPSDSEATVMMTVLTSDSSTAIETMLTDKIESGALLRSFIASAQDEGYKSSMAHVLVNIIKAKNMNSSYH